MVPMLHMRKARVLVWVPHLHGVPHEEGAPEARAEGGLRLRHALLRARHLPPHPNFNAPPSVSQEHSREAWHGVEEAVLSYMSVHKSSRGAKP